MELYNFNGVIIEQHQQEGGFCEVALTLLSTKPEDALLFSLASFYLAFYDPIKIDFVFNSFTRQRLILRAQDFTPNAGDRLIRAVLKTREEAAILFGLATPLFHHNPNKGTVQTSRLSSLQPYQKAEFSGFLLFKTFAEDIGWAG